jgi:hypothetical protein
VKIDENRNTSYKSESSGEGRQNNRDGVGNVAFEDAANDVKVKSTVQVESETVEVPQYKDLPASPLGLDLNYSGSDFDSDSSSSTSDENYSDFESDEDSNPGKLRMPRSPLGNNLGSVHTALSPESLSKLVAHCATPGCDSKGSSSEPLNSSAGGNAYCDKCWRHKMRDRAKRYGVIGMLAVDHAGTSIKDEEVNRLQKPATMTSEKHDDEEYSDDEDYYDDDYCDEEEDADEDEGTGLNLHCGGGGLLAGAAESIEQGDEAGNRNAKYMRGHIPRQVIYNAEQARQDRAKVIRCRT